MELPQRKGFITIRRISEGRRLPKNPSLTLFEVALFERAEGPTYRQPVAKATGTLRKKVFEA